MKNRSRGVRCSFSQHLTLDALGCASNTLQPEVQLEPLTQACNHPTNHHHTRTYAYKQIQGIYELNYLIKHAKIILYVGMYLALKMRANTKSSTAIQGSPQAPSHAPNLLRPSTKLTVALAQRIPQNKWVELRKKRRKEEKGVPRSLHTSFSFSQAPNTQGSPENIPLVVEEEWEE